MPNLIVIPQIPIEKGMYQAALSEGLTFNGFLEKLEREKSYRPPKGSADAELTAFERQLKAHGLRVSGAQVSLVDDFYKTGDSTALFPEYINTQIRLGMEKARNECILDDIISNTTTINSNSYTSSAVTMDDAETGARRVGEGADFPVITLSDASNSIKLQKVGHLFQMTYEVMRRKTIDQLSVHLQKIGMRLRRSMVSMGLEIIVNGDGNSNPAPDYLATGLTYDNLIDFDLEFDDFEPTVWVALKAGIAVLLKMTEFKDPLAGFNYQKTGKLIDPLGVTLRRQDTVPANTILGIDGSSAMEMVVEANSSLVEVDTVVSRQLKAAVISQNVGFAKIYTNASRAWDYS